MIIALIWKKCGYGCQIWGLACDSQINKNQDIQNSATKLVTACEWYVRNTTLHKDFMK